MLDTVASAENVRSIPGTNKLLVLWRAIESAEHRGLWQAAGYAERMTSQMLMGESRLSDVVERRQAFGWIAHRELGVSLTRIGRWLGRDHSTVHYGLSTTNKRVLDGGRVTLWIDAIVRAIRGPHVDFRSVGMTDLFLTYEGSGKFQCAGRLDLKLAAEKLETGEKVKVRLISPRSVKGNNHFHRVIRLAHMNQRGGPYFEQWEKLKAWLLVQAGHCTVMEFDGDAIDAQVVVWLRSVSENLFFQHSYDHDAKFGKWRVYKPKSVSFKACDREEFQPVQQAVYDIIETTICPGVKIDDLRDAAEKEAAA